MKEKRARRVKGKGRRIITGVIGLAAGALGATLLLRRRGAQRMKDRLAPSDYRRDESSDRWARPGMEVIFRAELKPGRSRAERTYRVAKLLPSGRVTLEGLSSEHAESEFEAPR